MHGAITCSDQNARQGGRNRSTAQATRSPGSNLNISLNKRISSIDSMQELCELIHASSTQFNHVNVATAFRRVLQMPRRGVSQDTVAKALRKLEESALQNIHDFESQGIANTLHIMAKQRHYKSMENLVLALEHRAETISGEFSS